jgi:hypothetical protein
MIGDHPFMNQMVHDLLQEVIPCHWIKCRILIISKSDVRHLRYVYQLIYTNSCAIKSGGMQVAGELLSARGVRQPNILPNYHF